MQGEPIYLLHSLGTGLQIFKRRKNKTLTKEQVDQLEGAFKAFKETNETSLVELKRIGQTTSETTEKLGKINNRLDEIETKANADTTAKQFADFSKTVSDAIKEIEGKLNRKGGIGAEQGKGETPQMQLFTKALRSGKTSGEYKASLTPEDVKTLIAGNDTTGGYLAPLEYINQILADIKLVSPIRQLVTVRTTSRPGIQVPTRDGGTNARWVEEVGTRTEGSQPTFGLKEIRANMMYAMAKVSQVDLEDSFFDLEAYLRSDYTSEMAALENYAFLYGNGVGQPEGLLTNASVASVSSGFAATLDGDALINQYYGLKEPYGSVGQWLMNRMTVASIRKLKDGDGNYIWAPGLAGASAAATILEAPYFTDSNMPLVAAGTTPILFGDFKRAYWIVDRLQMDIVVDPYKYAENGIVAFGARKRVGGQVVAPYAVNKMLIGT